MFAKILEFFKNLFSFKTPEKSTSSAQADSLEFEKSAQEENKYAQKIEGTTLNSKYFKLEEFKCKCGNCEMPENCPPQSLIDILENIREHFGKAVIINSGYRCPSHNAKVGGAKSSRHTYGDAVDIRVSGVPTKEVYAYVLQTFGEQPLGIAKKIISDPYRGFVHIDTRGKKARWSYPGSLE